MEQQPTISNDTLINYIIYLAFNVLRDSACCEAQKSHKFVQFLADATINKNSTGSLPQAASFPNKGSAYCTYAHCLR